MRNKNLKFVLFTLFLGLANMCFAAPPLSPQLEVVTRLYKTFAFEVAEEVDSNKPGFLDSSRSVLLTYLMPDLTALILADRKCAETTHEICRLDFSPLWGGQDNTGATYKIGKTKDDNKVQVKILYPSDSSTLIYRLSLTPLGWRIQDIEYANPHRSLLELLKAN